MFSLDNHLSYEKDIQFNGGYRDAMRDMLPRRGVAGKHAEKESRGL
jgi:hypothetical protein